MKNISVKIKVLFVVSIILMVWACKKKDYYIDGGISAQSEAEKQMTTYDFLSSRPTHVFDSLIKIIDLTNTKNIVNQPNITFFAAPNSVVQRFQRMFYPTDKLGARPLSKIGVDTLKKLLNRLIIPNSKITLEQAVSDKKKYYKDNNADSLYVYGTGGDDNVSGGVLTAGQTTPQQTKGNIIQYEHRKINKVDSVIYNAKMQTHNLITANSIIHVLLGDGIISTGASFGTGLKLKYYRSGNK